MKNNNNFSWCICPRCTKRLFKLLSNATVKNIAVYCKKCKKEIIIK